MYEICKILMLQYVVLGRCVKTGQKGNLYNTYEG